MSNKEIEQLKAERIALKDLNERLEKKIEKLEEEKASCMSLLGAYEDRGMCEEENAEDEECKKGQGVGNKYRGDCEEERKVEVTVNISIGKVVI